MASNNSWVLDVLADLRRFADKNGLPRLSDDLDIVAARALGEIAGRTPAICMRRAGDDLEGRLSCGTVIAGEDA